MYQQPRTYVYYISYTCDNIIIRLCGIISADHVVLSVADLGGIPTCLSVRTTSASGGESADSNLARLSQDLANELSADFVETPQVAEFSHKTEHSRKVITVTGNSNIQTFRQTDRQADR